MTAEVRTTGTITGLSSKLKLSVVTKPVGLEVAAPPPEVKLGGPGGWPSVGIGDGSWASVGIGDGGNPPDGGPGD